MIKLTFIHLAIWQNWCFGQFYHKRIDVLQNCSVFFVSDLASENLRGLRELFLQKNPAQKHSKTNFSNHHCLTKANIKICFEYVSICKFRTQRTLVHVQGYIQCMHSGRWNDEKVEKTLSIRNLILTFHTGLLSIYLLTYACTVQECSREGFCQNSLFFSVFICVCLVHFFEDMETNTYFSPYGSNNRFQNQEFESSRISCRFVSNPLDKRITKYYEILNTN